MNLTAHFSFAELTKSDYAIRHCLSNVPVDPEVLGNLHVLAAGLERVRTKVARPIVITSGYRSPKVNSGIGGAKDSRHLRGLAADIIVPGLAVRELAFLIDNWKGFIQFRKLILEGGEWCHIDFPDDGEVAKGDVYTATFHKDGVTYAPGIV